MAALQQIFGTPPLPVHKLSAKISTVGRHDECDVVLDSPAVSRYHVKICCENRRYFIEDLNSRNGTSVNGKMISRRTLINDGDQIDISTLPFKFLLEDSLTDASGDWGIKPEVVSISNSGSLSEEGLLRRIIVRPGDHISINELGTDSVRQNQIVARIPVADGRGAWPVVHNATAKLNHTLRMLCALRQATQQSDVLSRSLRVLCEVFPAATHFTIILGDSQGTEMQVGAVVTREAGTDVHLCLPVVRVAMQNSEALCYTEHRTRSNDSGEEPSLNSILVTPLGDVDGANIGAIQMVSSHHGPALTADDLEHLVILSQVVSFALEKVKVAESSASQLTMDRPTLADARQPPESHPPEPPRVEGYRLAGELMRASPATGSLIDYVQLADGGVACVLIAASGQGQESAQLITLLSSQLNRTINEADSSAKAVRESVTQLKRQLDDISVAISAAIVILDPSNSAVTISVAGHCSVYLISLNDVTEITTDEETGTPLGADREDCSEAKLQMNDDDILLVCSGSMLKLTSQERHTSSREKIIEVISDAAQRHRSVFEWRLRERLEELRGGCSLTDDVAFQVIHRQEDSGTVDPSPKYRIESETMDA